MDGLVFRDASTTTVASSLFARTRCPEPWARITPVEGGDGWLLAAGRGFVYLSENGGLRPLAEVAPEGSRMNDAVRSAGPVLGRHEGS